MERKNTWELYTKEQMKEMEVFSNEYRNFLDQGKTERECVDYIVDKIEAAGYVSLDYVKESGLKLQKQSKVYSVCMKKSVVMMQIGEEALEKGMNILGAHIDSPRLDIKQNPLFEEEGIAFLDTHYYGGIKKYQWVTIPLAIHGVVIKKDKTVVNISIGEREDEPVFFVSDLLIHLAQEQMEKTARKVIEGEALDILIGSRPLKIKKEKGAKEDSKDYVKKGILEILKNTYGMEEEDFISAELEVVPAGKAREAGMDRSMILGYGQDDRVCAFPSLKAMLEIDKVQKTACCLLVDKEEIGSVGATGMYSKFFENFVAEVIGLTEEYSELKLRRCLEKSAMLSSDVSSAFDPSYPTFFEKKNVAYLGCGIVFNKYTGSGGKSGSNDANAEYLGHLRAIMEERKINFQTGELGKVDVGGGGTIAHILAQYGMNVIDSGVPVLSMHAPWEAASKVDIYEAKRGYIAFLECTDM